LIEVVKIEYDAEQCALRVKGKNIRENEHVRLGQFHTIELEKGRPFTIRKPHWDTIRLDILKELENPMSNAEVAVLVMQEGLANLCLIRATMTKTCAVISRSIPPKALREHAIQQFFADIYAAVLLHINFEQIKVILVGSPGFLNDQFMTYFQQRVVQEERTDLTKLENRQKFVKVHASTGYKGAVEEVLSDPAIAERLQNVRAVKDVSISLCLLSALVHEVMTAYICT
jgi:protein pelota